MGRYCFFEFLKVIVFFPILFGILEIQDLRCCRLGWKLFSTYVSTSIKYFQV